MFAAFWRTLILYFLIVVSIRLMGKRQLGELQPTELVVTILISNIATVPIENTGVPMISGMIPILTLVCMELFASALALKSERARRVISGSPQVVIRNGQLLEGELRRLRYSISDLYSQLRLNQIFDISEVDYAVVETTGQLSVYKKSLARAPTLEDFGLGESREDAPPVAVVRDGVLQPLELEFLNLSEKWLAGVLEAEEVALSEVLVLSANRRAEYHIYRKEPRR